MSDFEVKGTPLTRNVRPGPDLSLNTLRRIDIVFPHEEDRVYVRKLLYDQIGNNLCFYDDTDLDPDFADRLRFAALKYSKGSLAQLDRAAKLDMRDLLCAAGFASNPEKHRRWEPKPPKPSTRPLTP